MPPAFWANLTFEYSLQNLTYTENILPSLSGTAKKMLDLQLGKYLAGMWEKQLPFCLMWTNRNETGYKLDAFVKRRKDRTERRWLAPSWSWASGPYPQSDSDWGHNKNISTCRIIACECFPSGMEPTGRLKGGSQHYVAVCFISISRLYLLTTTKLESFVGAVTLIRLISHSMI